MTFELQRRSQIFHAVQKYSLVFKMKLIFLSTVLLLVLGGFATETFAQSKLVILVRHAEKADATSPDPDLSAAGRERAQRLIRAIGKYRPGAFYSTDFIRTRETVTPLAAKRKKEVQIYDARKPQEMFDTILKSGTKRHVVSGHSNTIPGLVNLITKKDLFKNLDDPEYSVIWVIRIKDGRVAKVELLDY
jgi:2,3-bisphosphoglycerate-dependent phosphoglycerate mutase